jgi:leucyl aminopeptidase
MNIKGEMAKYYEVDVDALIVVVFEGEEPEGEILKDIDQRTQGTLRDLMTANELRGKINECTYIHHAGDMKARRLLLVGAGKREKFSYDIVRRTAGTAFRYLRSKGIKSAAMVLRPEWELKKAARSAVEGALLGLFDVDIYKTEDKESRYLEDLIFLADRGDAASLQDGIEQGKILAKATNFARNLVNEPSSVLTPTELASRAADIASRFGLDIEVLDEQQMKELGMGSILAVARGSDEPAKLIVLRYTPEGPSKSATEEVLALVGKGITFDSGGISIKPAEGMDRMKYDMAGGAVVLGAMRAIGQLRPPIRVLGIVPATENMPSGRAQKPGDVIRAMSGKTIEVINTDAEGRLILADALCYARKLGATRMVDLATLTGACVVALGSIYAAVLGNDQDLIDTLIASGEEAGERLWQLPLDEEYRELIKSDIADLKNSGGKKAGTITAAYFLKEFAVQTNWAHLDIAGAAWQDEKQPHLSAGPTGIGVRTLVHLAWKLSQKRRSVDSDQ